MALRNILFTFVDRNRHPADVATAIGNDDAMRHESHRDSIFVMVDSPESRWDMIVHSMALRENFKMVRDMARGLICLALGIVVIFIIIFALPHHVKEEAHIELQNMVRQHVSSHYEDKILLDYHRQLIEFDRPNRLQLMRNIFNEQQMSGITIHNYEFTDDEIGRRQVHNLIAYHRGTTEPDTYLIIGAELDDPASLALMLTISRLVLDMSAIQLWTPTKTIVFAVWGDRTHGASNWVDAYTHLLEHRALLHIHMALNDSILRDHADETIGVGATLDLHPSLEETLDKINLYSTDGDEATVPSLLSTMNMKKDTYSKVGPPCATANCMPFITRVPVSSVVFYTTRNAQLPTRARNNRLTTIQLIIKTVIKMSESAQWPIDIAHVSEVIRRWLRDMAHSLKVKERCCTEIMSLYRVYIEKSTVQIDAFLARLKEMRHTMTSKGQPYLIDLFNSRVHCINRCQISILYDVDNRSHLCAFCMPRALASFNSTLTHIAAQQLSQLPTDDMSKMVRNLISHFDLYFNSIDMAFDCSHQCLNKLM